MLKKTCQNCGSIIELNEDNYIPGEDVKVECQLCGEEAIFTIPKNEQEPKVVTAVIKGVKKNASSNTLVETITSNNQNPTISPTVVQAKAKVKIKDFVAPTQERNSVKVSQNKSDNNSPTKSVTTKSPTKKKESNSDSFVGCFIIACIILIIGIVIGGYLLYDLKQEEMQIAYEQQIAEERESARLAQEEAERANYAREAAEREQQELQRKIRLAQEFAGTYQGTIDDKYNVTVTLRADNTKITGEYYYDSGKNGTLRLEGSIEGTQLVMKEYNTSNEVCGTWRCRKEDDSILGQMTNSYDVSYSVNIKDVNNFTSEEKTDTYTQTSSHPSRIIVTGEHVRFRQGPSTDSEIIKYTNGEPVYPDKGEVLECVGETEEWYKVKYLDTYTFYISKLYTEPY